MGHILFGLPEIEHFHLLSRVARKLTSRAHRISVLTADPVTFEFFSQQGLPALDLRPAALGPAALGPTALGPTALGPAALGPELTLPVPEFAAVDCRLAGRREPGGRHLHRAVRRLERWVPAMVRRFELDRPDLVMIHGGRSGLHRLLHCVAKQYGCEVMHVAPGHLPLTLQVDGEGIDGDASFARATAQDYRRTACDDEFLAGATAAWLGRAFPPPLARLGVVAPPLRRRLAAAARACWQGQWRVGWRGLEAWRAAQDLPWPRPRTGVELPRAPFLCLLLQDPTDPRLRLDAGSQTTPLQFVHSTWQAVQRVDPSAGLVVVEPHGPAGLVERVAGLEAVHFVPASAAALAVATAMAVVTVNHPLALAAILAGTPVLHTAAAAYGIPGIATRTGGMQLAEDLAQALAEPGQPTLRRRFLTAMLKEHHIWCPPHAPDSNGVAGIVNWIETALGAAADRQPLRYRPGPVWPLAPAGARRHRRPDRGDRGD